jgi:hypothetical protein
LSPKSGDATSIASHRVSPVSTTVELSMRASQFVFEAVS